MKKPIIANVMLAQGLGGIEQAAVDYAQALRLAGFEVLTIIHPNAAIKNSLESANLPYKTLANFGAWDLWAIFKLRRLLKEHKIDACIAHGNRALSLLKYAVTDQKLIAAAHNYKIKFASAGAVFCPTQDLMRYVEAKGVVKKHIYYVPNMVRVQNASTEYKYNFDRPPVIGTMGRFVAKKGFDLFIESLAILKSSEIEFQAIIGGNGEEEETLKSLVDDRDLSGVVTFPGWVSDKSAFFESIDIFCLPSHHEPFGIVLLEAMAQELPVIATASEGPSEIIENNVNGLLVEKGNAEKLADGIRQLLKIPAQTRLMAKKASDTVRENYAMPVISKKLENAINSVVQG